MSRTVTNVSNSSECPDVGAGVGVSDVGERLDLVSISNFCVPDNGMVCVFDIGECL